jgi:hypothetical protein
MPIEAKLDQAKEAWRREVFIGTSAGQVLATQTARFGTRLAVDVKLYQSLIRPVP